MRNSRFSPTQITKILKEFDNGKSVEQISREQGWKRLSVIYVPNLDATFNADYYKRFFEQEAYFYQKNRL